MSKTTRNVTRRFILLLFLAGSCAILTRGWAEESLPVLVRTFQPKTERVPLIVQDSANGKISLEWVKLHGEIKDDQESDTIMLKFDDSSESSQCDSFPGQLWIAALASAMAWQEPWQSEQWTVTEIPHGDASVNGAALGVAFIAATAGLDYPQDTIVLGRLNPDGSLGFVPHTYDQMTFAAKSGIKRVVIPHLQQFEISDEGSTVTMTDLTEKLGIECVPVDDLTEAVEVVLHRSLPTPPAIKGSTYYSPALLSNLELRCQTELNRLHPGPSLWPRNPAKLDFLPLEQQILWRRLFRTYDTGTDAFSAGQLYVAYQFLREANAELMGLQKISPDQKDFNYQGYEARANSIRQQMVTVMTKPAIDHNELQSALVLCEESEWIHRLNASVEEAQMLARQVFSERSDATHQQKSIARAFLVSAVEEAEYQMTESNFYQECHSLFVRKEEIPVFNRATLLLNRLIPAELGVSETFLSGLKSQTNKVGESILYDPELFSFEHVLQDAKTRCNPKDTALSDPIQKVDANPTNIGFFPGPGYSISQSSLPLPTSRNLSDAALCLNWVNDYCEAAMLNQKYLYLSGSFDPSRFEWHVEHRATLQKMLQVAEYGARRGILFAQSVGADTSVLDLIYESASSLRASKDDNLCLEGLRQYWRCALLGEVCWHLGFIPQATAIKSEDSTVTTDSNEVPNPISGRLKLSQGDPVSNPILPLATNYIQAIRTPP